jgi:hypothetical protein
MIMIELADVINVELVVEGRGERAPVVLEVDDTPLHIQQTPGSRPGIGHELHGDGTGLSCALGTQFARR